MPIVQIDWQKIKSKLGDDTALFALTLRQASMLLGLSEQLTWEKTFRVEDYDWADKDILDADIADLQRNLAMPTNLVDIIQYIDEIEGLLRGMQSITNCCNGDDITGGDQYTDPVVDGVGDVPANVISAGYATGVSDWAGFDDYKCMISHIMVDQMELRLRKLHTLVDDTGHILGGVAVAVTVITTVFTTIITGGLSVMALGIIASTGIAAVLWKSITDATDLNILADAVATNHEELACAIYFGDGSLDSVELLKDKIDDLFTGSSAIILKNLNLEPTLKALYSGGYDQQNIAQLIADHGYDTADFDCSCTAFLGEYQKYTDFAGGGWDGWNTSYWNMNMTGGIDGTPCAWVYSTNPGERLATGTTIIRAWAGLGDAAGKETVLYRISFWYKMDAALSQRCKVTIYADSGDVVHWFDFATIWTYAEIVIPAGALFTSVRYPILAFSSEALTGYAMYIDNITLDYDATA